MLIDHVVLVFMFSHLHSGQLKKEQHIGLGGESTSQSDILRLELLSPTILRS